ncbi:MAG: rhodanese-related sulfurtransferase [Bacteroidia bacterium]|jgi:rhodanese-related sulfurtransferase
MNSITVKELKAKLDANEPLQLIDIRETWELEVAEIGAIHIPMGEILERSNELRTDVPCVIHCRTGSRSGKIIKVLEMHKGMTNLYNLEGGIIAWAQEIDSTLEQY